MPRVVAAFVGPPISEIARSTDVVFFGMASHLSRSVKYFQAVMREYFHATQYAMLPP